jgi:hypothetical protein
MMSRINSRHWTISTGCHFQNGRHNTAKIQHCPISSKFDMWVDSVSGRFGRLHIGQCWIFAVLWRPFWKWHPVEIVQCRELIRDIIIYPHIKVWWYRTMLNFSRIVVAILKIVTGRNCSMSRINSGHHYLPTYQIVMILYNVIITIWYVGR